MGVFEVLERQGENVVLRDLNSGNSLRVHEHSDEMTYGAGGIALGRLLPFGGKQHLRSPGMVFIEPVPGSRSQDLAEGLTSLTNAGMPAGVAIEGLITQLHGTRVPRDVPAATSASEAERLSYHLAERAEAAGLATRPPLDDVPPDMRKLATAGPSRRVVGLNLDWTLAEWMQRLRHVAEARPRTRRR